jgi:hypothetical protein
MLLVRRVQAVCTEEAAIVVAEAEVPRTRKRQQEGSPSSSSSFVPRADNLQAHENDDSYAESDLSPILLAMGSLTALLASPLSPVAAIALAAAAASSGADDVAYDASGGEGLVKTVFGGLYVALVSYFLWRVLGRRARRARQERLAGQPPVETPFTRVLQALRDKRDAMRAEERAQGKPGQAGPGDALLGAAQAALIAAGLWIFTTKVEVAVAGSSLPDGFTARNMAVTVRTILLGLLYLVTFIFSANAVGLAALSVQMVVDPASIPDDEQEAAEAAERRRRREEAQGGLPKVSVRSSPDDLKAAFAAAAGNKKREDGGGAAAANAKAEAQVDAGQWKVLTLSGEDDE